MKENNILLAEFIGGKLKGETNINIKPNEIWLPVFGVCNLDKNKKKLKFDSDWNWLMLVVEGIDKGSGEHIKLSCDIVEVHRQCVEFIKWYNDNK